MKQGHESGEVGTDRASLHRLSRNTNEFQHRQPLPQTGWREEETELQRGAFAGAACLFSKPPLLINVIAKRAAAVLEPGRGGSGERQATDSAQDAWAAQPFLLLHPQTGVRERKQTGHRHWHEAVFR